MIRKLKNFNNRLSGFSRKTVWFLVKIVWTESPTASTDRIAVSWMTPLWTQAQPSEILWMAFKLAQFSRNSNLMPSSQEIHYSVVLLRAFPVLVCSTPSWPLSLLTLLTTQSTNSVAFALLQNRMGLRWKCKREKVLFAVCVNRPGIIYI